MRSIGSVTVKGVNDAPAITELNSNHDQPCAGADSSVVSISGSLTDVDLSDTHTVTVDWGDGSPLESLTVDQLADTFTGDHAWRDHRRRRQR
jgi:hypothetical protein